ncbi:MAG: hypothetical protein LAT63_03425 [Marinobacter sp.]|nr:hypothetical protein [Marinobacter sp.]
MNESMNESGSSRPTVLGAPGYAAFFIMAVIVALGLSFLALHQWQEYQHRDQDSPADRVAKPVPDATEDLPLADLEDLAALDPAWVEAQQRLAATEAGRAQLNDSELILQRPAYVSPVEWQVLKAVAAMQEDSERELTRLVHHLHFNKQLELWQGSLSGQGEALGPVERTQLAMQILDAIPARVTNQELDQGSAHRLQLALLADLVEDPEERRLWAAEEAERIGVTFSLEGGY